MKELRTLLEVGPATIRLGSYIKHSTRWRDQMAPGSGVKRAQLLSNDCRRWPPPQGDPKACSAIAATVCAVPEFIWGVKEE